ncbi:MAG: hypothetical protein ACJAYH_002762 [Celeribacter sp.]|jgi:hypothetical protein
MNMKKMLPANTDAILRTLSLKPAAQKSLLAISLHPNCSRDRRQTIYRQDARIYASNFFSENCATEIASILLMVDGWLKTGEKTTLIWDEGCAHEGWLETRLPDDLAELESACVPLRAFLGALRDVLNGISAQEISGRLSS